MAANRTFQFIGLGFGAEPVTVTASINNTQIYSGTVTTVDQPVYLTPVGPQDQQVTLFTIDNSASLNTDFAGSLPMTVVVSGGTGVVFGEINSNYWQGNIYANIGAGTADSFGQCYTGTPVNSDSSVDVRSSAVLNGTPVVLSRPPDGVWNYYVPAGSTLSYNFNISAGQVANVLGDPANYSGPYTTT